MQYATFYLRNKRKYEIVHASGHLCKMHEKNKLETKRSVSSRVGANMVEKVERNGVDVTVL